MTPPDERPGDPAADDALEKLTECIRDALAAIDELTQNQFRLGSPAALELLLGTALKESGGLRWRRLNGGPARGLFQMEQATHDDIWRAAGGWSACGSACYVLANMVDDPQFWSASPTCNSQTTLVAVSRVASLSNQPNRLRMA